MLTLKMIMCNPTPHNIFSDNYLDDNDNFCPLGQFLSPQQFQSSFGVKGLKT